MNRINMIVTLLAASFSLNLAIAEDTKAIWGTDGASVKEALIDSGASRLW